MVSSLSSISTPRTAGSERLVNPVTWQIMHNCCCHDSTTRTKKTSLLCSWNKCQAPFTLHFQPTLPLVRNTKYLNSFLKLFLLEKLSACYKQNKGRNELMILSLTLSVLSLQPRRQKSVLVPGSPAGSQLVLGQRSAGHHRVCPTVEEGDATAWSAHHR